MFREDYFNPATYVVVDRVTGEEIDVDIFVEKASKNYWEKAYARTIAEYIGVTGTGQNKVLAYLIKAKDINNRIIGTVKAIAEKADVSDRTVAGVLKLLQERELVKKLQNGVYLLSPHVLRHGSKTRGAMLLRLWEEV